MKSNKLTPMRGVLCLMDMTHTGDISRIVGGAIAFGLGLWQYRVAQSWKRMEFTATEIAKFIPESELRSRFFAD